MTNRDLIRIVLANLSRMKLRASLTAVGVLVGTTAIVTMVSLGVGMQQGISAQMMATFGSVTAIEVSPTAFGESGPFAPSAAEKTPLTPDLVEEIADIDGVDRVLPRVSFPAKLTLDGKETDVNITGFDVEDPFDLKLEGGDWPANNRAKSLVAAAKVGDRLAQAEPVSKDSVVVLGERAKLTMTRQTDFGEEEKKFRARTVGQLKSRSPYEDYNTIYMPLGTASKLFEWQSGQTNRLKREGYDGLRVLTTKVEDIPRVESILQDLGVGTFTAKALLDGLNSFFMVLQAILGAIGAVALIVASIGIINTMIMSIYERTREIGIMKAVGASNTDVMKIFLAEAGTIGILGGAAGVVFGWLTAKVLGLITGFYMSQAGAGADAQILSFVVPWWLAAFAMGFAAVIGVAAGIYPALRASRLNPLDALRHD